jgi:hypothetical protein
LLALHIRLEIEGSVDEADSRAFADETALLNDA